MENAQEQKRDPEQVKPRIAGTISQAFVYHVQRLFELSFREYTPIDRREGSNLYTPFALPAYIAAASAVESYINEVFVSDLSMSSMPEGYIKQLKHYDFERAEEMSTLNKIVLLPLLAYGKMVEREKRPFTDLCHLIQIRNGLTHFKFKFGEEKVKRAVTDLMERRIAFSDDTSKPGWKNDPISTWHERISTTEGIRWAHNCVISTINELINLHPAEGYRSFHLGRYSLLSDNAAEIHLNTWRPS